MVPAFFFHSHPLNHAGCVFLRLCRQSKNLNVFKFVKLLKFWKALSCHIPVSHFAKSYFINGIKENKIFAILLWQFNSALLVVAKLIWLSSKTISIKKHSWSNCFNWAECIKRTPILGLLWCQKLVQVCGYANDGFMA